MIEWTFTDLRHDRAARRLSNGALIQTENPRSRADPDLSVTLTKAQLLGLLAGGGVDGIDHSGDLGVVQRFIGLLDPPEPRVPDRDPVTRGRA